MYKVPYSAEDLKDISEQKALMMLQELSHAQVVINTEISQDIIEYGNAKVEADKKKNVLANHQQDLKTVKQLISNIKAILNAG